MKTYLFRLFAHAFDREPLALERLACASDAQALDEACRLLERHDGCAVVEAWIDQTELFRVGDTARWRSRASG